MPQKIFRRLAGLMLALAIPVAGFTSTLTTRPTHTLLEVDTPTLTATFTPSPYPSPANDDFANATVISTLPFSDIVNIIGATLELNEPPPCESLLRSVWYRFTPATDMMVSIDMKGSNFDDTTLSVYEGSDIAHLNFIYCSNWWGNPINLNIQAGVTYYIRAGDMFYGNGYDTLQLNLQAFLPPPNDNFTSAKMISSLPFDDTVDTIVATKEPGEPKPSCAFDEWGKSIWYAYTPAASESLIASIPWANFAPVLAVYTGDSLTSLREVGCRLGENFVFHVNAGVAYYFQVSANWKDGGPVAFHLEVAPSPSAWFWFDIADPSVFDTIQFFNNSYDPANVGFQSAWWDFGDGTTSTSWDPTHKYPTDGDYTVNLTVMTYDGRTASISQVVHVRTHDVAITKISAPQSASSGQTRTISIYVNNKRYGEYVRIDLYKSVPGGFQWVGAYTQFIPVRPSNRTTLFTFNYTFTREDASRGKINFKAFATIVDARDAWPADNELTSSPPTKVTR